MESVAWLQRLGASGPIFAPDHHGGYLELETPALKPFIDTRLILHTAEEYAAYLAAVERPAARFDALDARFAFRYVVLTTSYPDRYLALAQYLARSPASSWRLVFTDGSEALFARAGVALDLGARANTEATLARLAERFRHRPDLESVARLHLARFLLVLGVPREALAVLATLDDAAAFELRARAYLVAGEPAAAEALARIFLARDPSDVRNLVLLAEIRLAARDIPGALRWVRQAVVARPYDPEARELLSRIEESAAELSPAPAPER